MTSALEIINPGMMASIQDLGRFGYQAQGVPVSGALDGVSLRLANALVGNPQGQGAMEFRVLGPTIRILAESVRIALTGTNSQFEIVGTESRTVDGNCSVTVKRGDVVRIGAIPDSAVCYLAVEGGFDLVPVHGSQSTYLAGGFGGFQGRLLKAGDCLPLHCSLASPTPDLRCNLVCPEVKNNSIRVVPGPQDDYFSEEGLETFFSQAFQISADANRMGLRLEGPAIAHSKGREINSDGVVTGAIQVPGNGQPILLLADHQTTGGYPKIGTVASADLPKLGRMKPGAMLRFQRVSVQEAEAARHTLEREIEASIASIAPMPSESERLAERLAALNLISGIVSD